MKHPLLLLFSIIVSAITHAQLPVAAFGADDSIICPGYCTSFTNLSSNTTAYHWSFAGAVPSTSTTMNPQNICYLNPGNYAVTLIATNANGSDTLTIINCITVLPYPPPMNLTSHGDTFFVNQVYAHYKWYLDGVLIPNDTLYYHVAIPDGTHTPVGVDANGCEVESADWGIFVQPDFAPSDTLLCEGDCISLINLSIPNDSAMSDHQWHFSGATPSTSLDFNPQNICYSSAGSYWIKLVMLGSLSSYSDSFMVSVVSCTGILENDISSNYFSVLPNPFSSNVSFYFNQAQDSKAVLKIFNSLGEIVIEKPIHLEDQTHDLSALPQGVYLISIIAKDKIYTQKIVKFRF